MQFLLMGLSTLSCKENKVTNKPFASNEGLKPFAPLDIGWLLHLPIVNLKSKLILDLDAYFPQLVAPAGPLSQGNFNFIMAKAILPERHDASEIHSHIKGLSWRIVGMRIEPCYDVKRMADKCEAEFRLVAQPIGLSSEVRTTQKDNIRNPIYEALRTDIEHPGSSKYAAEDAALHLIYKMTKDDFRIAMKKILEIKSRLLQSHQINLDSSKLGVHPGFKSDTSRGYMLQNLRELLKNYAVGTPNEVEFLHTAGAVFDDPMIDLLQNPSEPKYGYQRSPIVWTFQSFALKAGRLEVAPMGHAQFDAKGKPSEFQSIGMDVGVRPESKRQKETFQQLIAAWRERAFVTNSSSTMFLEMPESKREINGVATLVDNPYRHTIRSTDCVTCHASTTLRTISEASKALAADFPLRHFLFRMSKIDLLRRDLYGDYWKTSDLPAEFREKSKFSITAPLPEWNLRNFGYYFQLPSISQRAANDLIAGSAFLNEHHSDSFRD